MGPKAPACATIGLVPTQRLVRTTFCLRARLQLTCGFKKSARLLRWIILKKGNAPSSDHADAFI